MPSSPLRKPPPQPSLLLQGNANCSTKNHGVSSTSLSLIPFMLRPWAMRCHRSPGVLQSPSNSPLFAHACSPVACSPPAAVLGLLKCMSLLCSKSPKASHLTVKAKLLPPAHRVCHTLAASHPRPLQPSRQESLPSLLHVVPALASRPVPWLFCLPGRPCPQNRSCTFFRTQLQMSSY